MMSGIQLQALEPNIGKKIEPYTVLVGRIEGSLEWTDLGFNPIDTGFYALFVGVIFKIATQLIFKRIWL